ncbi:beta-1,3-glucanase family protein [Mycolicibacterium vanbaalenii]|nr:beta-1,3-glucanase family protein [Mycolicibacterium vanbaalenii]
MTKPSTADVFRADGPFVGTGLQGAFLAELDAAFNRGVATSPDDWNDVSAYYPAGGRWNDWARFFHAHSLNGFAYGFPYDDVNSQSSVVILNNAEPLTDLRLTLTS